LLGPGFEYSYLVAADDSLSREKIEVPGPVYSVVRPRWKNTRLPAVILRTLWCALQSVRALIAVRPHAVVSAGPGPAVPVSILSKVAGITVIYVETGSRVFSLSSSGRILYRIADLFFVQWPELLRQCPEAIYAGRLF
jgi:UDP-N-acetylglucosamine:LPS N-acetylglucosamine transferase